VAANSFAKLLVWSVALVDLVGVLSENSADLLEGLQKGFVESGAGSLKRLGSVSSLSDFDTDGESEESMGVEHRTDGGRGRAGSVCPRCEVCGRRTNPRWRNAASGPAYGHSG
jgi:hypothetical protein